jgi:hypothetical protein
MSPSVSKQVNCKLGGNWPTARFLRVVAGNFLRRRDAVLKHRHAITGLNGRENRRFSAGLALSALAGLFIYRNSRWKYW